MTKIDKILKKLSDLYEFNRRLKAYELQKKANKSIEKESAKDRCAP